MPVSDICSRNLDQSKLTKIMEGIKRTPIMYQNNYVPETNLERFQKLIERKYNLNFAGSYKELHKWTVENYVQFWEELWHFLEVISSKPYDEVLLKTGPGFLDNEWFSGAKLNYAENLLRRRDDAVAIMYLDELGNEEKVTFAEMFEKVKLYAAAFRKNGLKIGDRVACFMSNRMEAIFAMLAVASIGGMWGGPLPFYGIRVASNLIKTMDPKFLITIDEHQYNKEVFPILDHLPAIVNGATTIEKVILVVTKKETSKKNLSGIRNCVFLEDFLAEGRTPDGRVPDIVFEQLPFDHPLHIDFTSGTTGLPKAPVHRAGTFLSLAKDYALSYNIKRGDVVAMDYPVGWTEWEHPVSTLALGATLFLNSSSITYDHNGKNYWDIMAKYNVNISSIVTSLVDKMEKLGLEPSSGSDLDCLKIIQAGASAVKPHNFEYIRSKVKDDAYVPIFYGCTELLGHVSGFNLNMPFYAGEIQVPGLGIDLQCLDSEGRSVVGQRGELVLCTPAPSFLIGLWKDEEKKRLTSTYLTKYPGVWCLHDEGWINPKTYGFNVLGRSDDTLLNQKGVRLGASDIYSAIHSIEELQDYICVGQKRDNGDNRAVLFVKMQNDYKMTREMKAKIEKKVHEELWGDWVPDLILEVPDIPYNLNNKRVESVIRKILETNAIPEGTNARNPDCLKHFLNIPEIVNYRMQCVR